MLANGEFTHTFWHILFVLFGLSFSSYVLCAPAAIPAENELLLELRLDGESLGLDILGYQRGDDFFLSLDELSNGLGLPIAVDGVNGLASGWYITEDRGFSLDIKQAEVISGGIRWPIVDGDVMIFEDGLFVETNVLQNWLPLRLSVVVRELYLDVEAKEPLPIQTRGNRRDRVLTISSGYQKPQHPLQSTPYQFVSPHVTQLRLGYSTVRQTPDSAAEYGVKYASLSRGDLGWMTSTLSFAGQSGDAVAGARLKLERTAFAGPMGFNHIEMGDVDAGGSRGILVRGGRSQGEKGGRIDNETVTLEGSQLPDWDVELYQNGQFFMIQTTGQDGRYVFESVPLRFGENHFELKLYGPNGEVETREEYHFLGKGMLKKGGVSYEVTAVQSGRTVFGVNQADGEGDRDSVIYTGEFNLGVSRNLTVGAGMRSLEKMGERFNSSNIGIGLSTSRLYGSVRYFDAPGTQNSVNTSLRTQLGDTNLNVGYTRFLAGPDPLQSLQKWRSNADITSTVMSVPIKLEVSTQKQNDITQTNAVLGTTKSLSGSGRLASSVWYGAFEERLKDSNSRATHTGGQSSFHTVIKPWTFRLSTSYSFAPKRQLLGFSTNGSLLIEKGLKLNFSIRRNPATDTTYYGTGVNWQIDNVAINASVNYDSDERWGGLITLSTALVHQRGTLLPRLDRRATVDTGSVEVRVFEDTGDGEEEPHAGVGINGVQVWRHATTDKYGVAYLSLPAHRHVDIELDESTLPEFELRSKRLGVSTISRPGSYAVIDFPIVRTAELEGHVVIGVGVNNEPASRALVRLKTLNGDLVAQTRTAFDGFYLFEGIEPGVYQLSLEETLARRLINRPDKVTVLSSSGVIRDLDFNLRVARAKKIVLSGAVQEESIQTRVEVESSVIIPEYIARALPGVDTLTNQKTNVGHWFVQLGAYGSRELAQLAWKQISQTMQLLQDKLPRFAQHKSLTRLLVGPGRSKNDANHICQQLKDKRMDCIVRVME